jgi:hypothetical protein
MEKEKVSPITKTKINKTLYDDIQCNEYSEHNLCEKFSKNGENQYICEICDYMTSKKSSYSNHLSSKKHQEKVSENKNKYICKFCDYITSIKSHYDKHLSSKKHTKNYARLLVPKTNTYSCDICDYSTSVKYTYNKHLSSKSHIKKTQITNPPINKDSQVYSSIMDELKNMMLEQTTKITEEQAKMNKEQAKMREEQAKMKEEQQTKIDQIITEIANKPATAATSSISNNTNINNNNQHFNMNMFLNETCKDAMNLSDFMKNLTVTMEDMELTGQLGFVKGMTRIIVNNLNALDVCKRPIHCSDAKRETLYVKNNGVWEKETDDKEFTKALIRRVRHLSDIQLSKWRYLPKNKGYERYDHHKNMEFLTLVYEIHQFREEEIDKLRRNIIRHVVIDKSLYLR